MTFGILEEEAMKGERQMTRTEVLLTMHGQISRRIFRTMQLGGNTRQLEAMEAEGLISSESRGGRGRDRRNWFLSDKQHAHARFLLQELVHD